MGSLNSQSHGNRAFFSLEQSSKIQCLEASLQWKILDIRHRDHGQIIHLSPFQKNLFKAANLTKS